VSPTGRRCCHDHSSQVRLNDNLPTVTGAQRMQFVNTATAAMAAVGIEYHVKPGGNNVHFSKGHMTGQGRLLDVDVIFQSFKDDVREPPNPKAMAHSLNGQNVVKYIKRLPSKFTNLPAPKVRVSCGWGGGGHLRSIVQRCSRLRVPRGPLPV
jgi:hypothetical protein